MRIPVLLAAVLLAGCAGAPGGSGAVVCPAIGWVDAVRVELTGDWTGPAPASVRVVCEPSCGQVVRLDRDPEPRREVTAPLTGTTAGVPTGTGTPDAATVTVLAADGGALAEVDADLDWVRVGGSEECGGPMEATVVVPAP
ncbi:hypothetical protein GCM10027261_06880 [Geodermatophilus arenarius]|uniref:hypothetical protein n=1 Tax=Geodermatophilus arenarius TaxID=1137990 RepID=UPI0036DF7C32